MESQAWSAEPQSETAATRLVWAAGYFTDEDYYLPELQVEKMPRLQRGAKFVTADGLVHGVRLERSVKGQKKSATWSWFKNPFVGTKELDGLKIMMALINNWDLKEINNEVYNEKGEANRYVVVADLGASFGETGDTITRSKSNVADYTRNEVRSEDNGGTCGLHSEQPPVCARGGGCSQLCHAHKDAGHRQGHSDRARSMAG